jgi:hypothetical protein
MEAQIERFASGFKDLDLARSTMTAMDAQTHNPNYVSGDFVGGGAGTLHQTMFDRPRGGALQNRGDLAETLLRLHAAWWRRHGICGVGAARGVLADLKQGRAWGP